MEKIEGGRSRLEWVRIGEVRGMSVWLWAATVMLGELHSSQMVDIGVAEYCDSAKGRLWGV